MGKESEIPWTQATWNPFQGCRKKSEGCRNCYMYRQKKMYGQDPSVIIRSAKNTFNAPLKWKEHKVIFVCSWSDFFIEDADQWREEAWDVMRKANQHTYLLLTKRPENIVDRLPDDWGNGWDNVWLGVTAENQKEANKRIPILLRLSAYRKFISAEPLLSSLCLERMPDPYMRYGGTDWEYTCLEDGEDQCLWSPDNKRPLGKVDWVICGAESGPNRRETKIEWVRDLKNQCLSAGIPFMYKQGPDDFGNWVKMPVLDGKVWDGKPEVLR